VFAWMRRDSFVLTSSPTQVHRRVLCPSGHRDVSVTSLGHLHHVEVRRAYFRISTDQYDLNSGYMH